MQVNPSWFTVVGLIVSIVATVGFLLVKRREDQGWSLSAAMSEVIGYDTKGNPKYSSSSSRFIALMGFIMIFWVYAGVALLIVEDGGRTPAQLKDIEGFLFFGVAMFAPYIANQVKAALVGFGKGIPTGLPAADPPAPDAPPAPVPPAPVAATAAAPQ
jgi:LPXTG-motif cell wall-anchored protein